MSYISRVYKDTNNLKAYNSEEARNLCLGEESQGNIPIILHWSGRRHIKLYVSKDVSINDILTSLTTNNSSKITQPYLCQLFTYSEKNCQYESPRKITDYSLPIEQFNKEQKIQVVLWFTQELDIQ